MSNMRILFSIVDYSKGDELLSLYRTAKLPVVFSTHGHGCADTSIFEYLGFGENKKSVAICALSDERAKYIFSLAEEAFNISKPGKGIIFTVPASSATAFLAGLVERDDKNQPKITADKEKKENMSDYKYELIITIITSGFSAQVKDAAVAAGARGGTLIHALGLGGEEAKKFLGIAIQPEKEIVLNVVKREEKAAVMKAIAEAAGINTEGRGIIFSLPVDEAVGLSGVTKEEKGKEEN